MVCGWTPDGTAVLFSSWREVPIGEETPLFTVPVGGGFPTRLPVPYGHGASYSPDGARLAYMPQADVTAQWKNYRGGTHARIWILRLQDLAVEPIPQPAGSFNDVSPRWMGGSVYFRSDRNGEFNLFVYDTQTRTVRQLTHFEDFPVLNLDANGGNVIFEQAGYLHRFDLASGRSERLKIGVAAELPEARPRFASLAKDESRAVTDGMSDATEPAFDASGKYLYFFSSTDAGPVNQWFNLSSTGLRATRSLYLALLRKDTPSPFLRESDEEKAEEKKEKEEKQAEGKPEPVRIDFDGLDRRLLPFPLPASDYRLLAAGGAGQVLYLSQPAPGPGAAGTAMMRYDLNQRKEETLLSGVDTYPPPSTARRLSSSPARRRGRS